MPPLVVISYYDRRPLEPLIGLLDSLDRHPAGALHERVVCINRSGGQALPAQITSRIDAVLERPNVGMNIGAWDAAWRHWPGRPAYLFLQDECLAVRDGWMRSVLDALDAPGVGLVGEALNPAWDKPWEVLRDGPGRDALPEHEIDGVAANRVDVYLQQMRRNGIDPGPVGRHLRALVWAARGPVLEALDGFPKGSNYGECIAAEIGVSRAIEARGLGLRQLGTSPFQLFRHLEWNQDVAGGPYTHKPIQLRERQRLLAEVAALRAHADTPTWGALLRMIRARLGMGGGRMPR